MKPLSADFPSVVVDQSAQTLQELMSDWPKSHCQLTRFANEQIQAGRWERVAKRIKGRLTPAYRRVKR